MIFFAILIGTGETKMDWSAEVDSHRLLPAGMQAVLL
jgi:hypothetical protein